MWAYNKIFKQAYGITKNNKFLWIYGLFLSLGILYLFGHINLHNHLSTTYVLRVAFFVVVFLVVVRSVSSLIIAIKALIDKQETSIGKAYKVSTLFFGRIANILLSIYFSLFVLSMILWWPIVFMFDQGFIYRARILLCLAVMIYLPVFVIGLIVSILAPLFVVIYDLKTQESLGRTFELFGKNGYSLIGLFSLLTICDMPALFLAYFVVGLRGGPMVSILGGIVFLLFQSVFIVFAQTVWVLVFLNLIQPQKLEETAPIVLPEIV